MEVKVKFDDSESFFNCDLKNIVNVIVRKQFSFKIKLMTKRNISSQLLQYGINIELL